MALFWKYLSKLTFQKLAHQRIVNSSISIFLKCYFIMFAVYILPFKSSQVLHMPQITNTVLHQDRINFVVIHEYYLC